MVGISRLYCGSQEWSDKLRYHKQQEKRPVVVYNMTPLCNLGCVHCYSHATASRSQDELSTDQAIGLINDLADFKCPVILFSGGEPLLRPDCIPLISYASSKGLRPVVSTNGTQIDKKVASELKAAGLMYAGISIDGLREKHDRFRKVDGSFEAAIGAIDACNSVGLKAGLRFTLTKMNMEDLPQIFDLVEREKIPRICVYHLVYSGRGANLRSNALTHEETRKCVDLIIDKTFEFHQKGMKTEVLTVDNLTDGPYLYLRMLKEGNPRAKDVLELLRINNAQSSGIGIGCVNWNGDVYADQFWRHYSFGNVLKRPFGEIWTDLSDPLMMKLKNKRQYVEGRCAKCRFLDICGGNNRVRAEAVFNNVWAEEPDCYLTDEEIQG